MRRLLATTLIAAALPSLALPGLAQAQERPSLLSYFSFDILMQRVLQSGVMALRTQLDLTYSDVSVDLRTGSLTISDLRAWPLPEWDFNGDCEVSADSITIRSAALDRPDRARLKAQLTGVSFPDACLPEDAREPLAMAGLSTVDIPRLTFDLDYGFPASDAVVRLYADVEGAAAVDLTANMTYVWFDGRDDIEEPKPVVFLESATLALENKGLWEALSTMLPPPATGEGSPQFIEAMLGQGLTELNRQSRDEDTSLTDPQRALIGSIVETWPAFLARPDTLVLETDIEGDVFVDIDAINKDSRVLFAALNPKVSLAPQRAQSALPLDVLNAALNPSDDTPLSVEDQKRAGLALMTGNGAPRNLEVGYDLLSELAHAGDGEAAMVISDAMADRVPTEAYGFALLAGVANQSGAAARLDRLERELTLERILELQQVAGDLDQPDASTFDSVAQVRAAAAAYLSGKGKMRNYERAAMFAMIGSAAGDPESADILSLIDERVRMSGDGAFEVWSSFEAQASTAAMQAWIDQDLGSRYAK